MATNINQDLVVESVSHTDKARIVRPDYTPNTNTLSGWYGCYSTISTKGILYIEDFGHKLVIQQFKSSYKNLVPWNVDYKC